MLQSLLNNSGKDEGRSNLMCKEGCSLHTIHSTCQPLHPLNDAFLSQERSYRMTDMFKNSVRKKRMPRVLAPDRWPQAGFRSPGGSKRS